MGEKKEDTLINEALKYGLKRYSALIEMERDRGNYMLTNPQYLFIYTSRQIAIADRIVINKKDLLTDTELQQLQKDIRDVNTLADILQTERSRYIIHSFEYQMD